MTDLRDLPTDINFHEKFLRRAVELSYEGFASGKGLPFGAVVVRNWEIVGEGYNDVMFTQDPTAHGEMVAIRRACAALGTADLSDCDLYVISECCPMCYSAAKWARIRTVYYGCLRGDLEETTGMSDQDFYTQLARSYPERTRPTAVQVSSVAAEARACYQKWGDTFGKWTTNRP